MTRPTKKQSRVIVSAFDRVQKRVPKPTKKQRKAYKRALSALFKRGDHIPLRIIQMENEQKNE